MMDYQAALKIVDEKYTGIPRYLKLHIASKISTAIGDCKLCYGVGTKFRVVSNDLRTEDCFCSIVAKKKLRFDEAYEKSNLPLRYKGASLDKLSNTGRTQSEIDSNVRMYDVISNYIRSINQSYQRGTGIFICGPHGVGKTYISCAISNQIIQSGYSLRYIQFASLISLVFSSWKDSSDDEKFKELVATDFIVIDDVDKVVKTRTGIENSLFDIVLRSRIQANRPIIMSSNLPMQMMVEFFSESVYSMLSEHCIVVEIVGSDYRQQIAEKNKA